MRKKAFFTFTVTLFAIECALGLVWLFAPWLLPTTPSPFYENIFNRPAEPGPDGFVLLDPLAAHRAPQLYPDRLGIGPNDVLGFRNRYVPSYVDVVTLGSSTTYGNNAVLEENWPSQMQQLLRDKQALVYNMATGGWGPVQEFGALDYALQFRPQIVVIAFNGYNDSLNSIVMARKVKQWNYLLNGLELARGIYMTPPDRTWKTALESGQPLEFTPGMRLVSNDPASPQAMLGYKLMARISELMVEKAKKSGVHLLFTIIPTKELVFLPLLTAQQVQLDNTYATLTRSEAENALKLKNAIEKAGGEFVDVLLPLQNAVKTHPEIYPENDSHPLAGGYEIIAQTIAASTRRWLKDKPHGFVAVRAEREYPFDEISPSKAGSAELLSTSRGKFAVYFADAEGSWLVDRLRDVQGVDVESIPVVDYRDLATIPMKGFYSKR
ncbi:SGNH/GDSL hydrolase family protein [Bradyrhizobium sp. WSM471]|uniref:SGNH/GDSL hydrolase family protein n=1 Tax=Bradyrhizobium sp. WSM471 TaxID=319017 RepID=UPI00024D2A8D|nr:MULTISPECIES: GDSL-type esterase/lipase family protein [Bradyrhizobium]EHR04606.1 hypothetical protein Bra471DRAFT_05409 [Bradyrhizobium sp. WSM471]UFW39758.1 hypothetical protein BcanWSM471_26550 [Bradyrhizobium canariense]